jgi:hypothetical protein
VTSGEWHVEGGKWQVVSAAGKSFNSDARDAIDFFGKPDTLLDNLEWNPMPQSMRTALSFTLYSAESPWPDDPP